MVFIKHTLSHHSFGYLHESCYISTFHIVYITIGFSTVLYTSLMNIFMILSIFVYFFLTPAQFDRILSHFQSRYRYAACIGCFARGIQDFGFLEYADSFRGRRHVCTFADSYDTIGNQLFGFITVQFVLSGRG